MSGDEAKELVFRKQDRVLSLVRAAFDRSGETYSPTELAAAVAIMAESEKALDSINRLRAEPDGETAFAHLDARMKQAEHEYKVARETRDERFDEHEKTVAEMTKQFAECKRGLEQAAEKAMLAEAALKDLRSAATGMLGAFNLAKQALGLVEHEPAVQPLIDIMKQVADQCRYGTPPEQALKDALETYYG